MEAIERLGLEIKINCTPYKEPKKKEKEKPSSPSAEPVEEKTNNDESNMKLPEWKVTWKDYMRELLVSIESLTNKWVDDENVCRQKVKNLTHSEGDLDDLGLSLVGEIDKKKAITQVLTKVVRFFPENCHKGDVGNLRSTLSFQKNKMKKEQEKSNNIAINAVNNVTANAVNSINNSSHVTNIVNGTTDNVITPINPVKSPSSGTKTVIGTSSTTESQKVKEIKKEKANNDKQKVDNNNDKTMPIKGLVFSAVFNDPPLFNMSDFFSN